MLALGSIGVAQTGQTRPVEASLCDIITNPVAYDGRVVRFRAAVLTDWKHRTILFSKSCHGVIDIDDYRTPAAEAQTLSDAIGTPMGGGLDRTAIATFSGKLSYTPERYPHIFAMVVYSVKDVEVRRPRIRR